MILCVCPNPSVDTYWWMDDIKPGAVNRISKQEAYPGGKGVHVALNIAELGEAVMLMCIWAGNKGEWIKAECEKRNVTCNGILVAGENRSCITVVGKSKEIDNTEFLETGPSINKLQYNDLLATYKKDLGGISLVVLSGSWPGGAPRDAYGSFIDAANKKNIPVWVDCSGALLNQSLLHQPYGVHVNKDEAVAICGDVADAKKYFLQYVQQLALTAGDKGLYFFAPTGEVHAVCHVENVISTVGCGDALLAGITTASVRNFSLKDIVKYGAACGGANCMRHELGMINKKDVETLLQKTITESV